MCLSVHTHSAPSYPFPAANPRLEPGADQAGGRRALHLDPGATEQVEVLIEQTQHPQSRLVIVVGALVEEDVGDDVVGREADDKGGVEGLAWKTGEPSGRFARGCGRRAVSSACEETP